MNRPRIAGLCAAGAVATLALGLPAGAAAKGDHPSAFATVTVTITDGSLRASPTTPASGKTTFVVRNRGKKAHALLLKGPGVRGARTPMLAAGRSAKLTVTLRSGPYVLSDPIRLGPYKALFLDVIPATSVSAKGDGSVVNPTVNTPPPMCGYTP